MNAMTQPKMKTVTFRVTEKMHAILARLAAENKMTMSQIARLGTIGLMAALMKAALPKTAE